MPRQKKYYQDLYRRAPQNDISYCGTRALRNLGLPNNTFDFDVRFTALMDSTRNTYESLENKSGIARSTIYRIATGQIENPKASDIIYLSMAMELYPWDIEDLLIFAGYNLQASSMRIYRIAIWEYWDKPIRDCRYFLGD